MNKYSNQSKGKRVLEAQRKANASHPGPVVAAPPTRVDIAKHAHGIYVERGRLDGHNEQDWLQAEQELKNQQNWLQAQRDVTHEDPEGYRGDY